MPSTQEYYLVFYYDVLSLLDRCIIQHDNRGRMQYMYYEDFDEIKEIGSGGYGSVYTARYILYTGVPFMKETIVLKRINNSDEKPELFIAEVSNS